MNALVPCLPSDEHPTALSTAIPERADFEDITNVFFGAIAVD